MTDRDHDSVVLLLTHFIDDVILGEYEKLVAQAGEGYDIRLIYNTTEDVTPSNVPKTVKAFLFNEDDIRALPYAYKDKSISSYNVELFALNYFLNFSDYSYYWVMEYDMRFSGNWRSLFDAFEDDASDLIATTLFRYRDNPFWENWKSLSKEGQAIAEAQRIRAFLPIYRISRQALYCLHDAYRRGWAGHCEASVATILAEAGMTLEDMGGIGEFVRPGNENRFYRNTPLNWTHAPGTLVYRPVRDKMGEEADKLWHPVKSRPGMAVGRREQLARKAKLWMKRWGE